MGSQWVVSLESKSAPQEQRKSSIKTNTVNGNTKTPLTSSPPMGPHPYPLQGAAYSLRRISSLTFVRV